MAKHALSNVDGFVKRSSEIFLFDPKEIVVVDGWNARTDFSGEDELKNSIIENGVLQALIVKKNKDGKIELVDGERRLRATLKAISEGNEIQSVPVKIVKRGTSEIDLFVQSIIANDGKPFTPVEEAECFKKLYNWNLTMEEISKKVGKSITHVRNRLILSNAIPEVKKAVTEKDITLEQAKDIVETSDGSVNEQRETLEKTKLEKEQNIIKPKPLKISMKNDNIHYTGGNSKDDECEPIADLFVNEELKSKLDELGFDITTLKISISKKQ